MIERALPSMAWGPDGDGVIELQDGFSILEHPLGGGLPRLIGRLGGRDRVMNLHWSPDGSRLAMSRGYYPNDLMIIKGLR